MLSHQIPSPVRAVGALTVIDRVRFTLDGWLSDFAHVMGVGAFSRLADDKLSNHHWAAESALQRAKLFGEVGQAAELTLLVRGMKREMRRRSML